MEPLSSRKALLGTLLASAASLTLLLSCGNGEKLREGKAPVTQPDRNVSSIYPALHGTIGEFALLADSQPMPVEGYGIVAELPGTGSGEMRPTVREYLDDQLRRAGAASYTKGTEGISPERILASKQIAAVEVRGEIPPLARKGTLFDLTITALPESETTSLRDGLLWTSVLRRIGFAADTGLETDPIAVGKGPTFCLPPVETIMNPAAKETGKRSLRSARVTGGGIVTVDRAIRLQLYSPSYRLTLAIDRAINSRFPGRVKVADALGDSLIALKIPPEFNDAPGYFVDLVTHMYLSQETPGFTEKRAAELLLALKDPNAPHRQISLALQGLGRSIVPDYLEPAYISSDPVVRFWAGRAGAALGDVGGLVVLQEFGQNRTSPLRDAALKAIVEVSRNADSMRAAITLGDMLKSNDTAARIAAYEGLRAINARTIIPTVVGRKFYLDLVPSDSPPLIYVTQTGSQRIALIGRTINLPSGTLYISDDNALTVNVAVDAPASSKVDGRATITASAVAATQPSDRETVDLYWRSPGGERTATLKCTPNLAAVLVRLGYSPDPKSPSFDPKQPFIGVSYQRVVEMLAQMTKEQAIDAEFVLEKAPPKLITPTDIAEEFRPEKSTTATQPAETQPATMPATQPEK